MRSIHQLCFALQLGIPSTVSTLNATMQLTNQRWRYCFIRPGLTLYCQWSNCQQVVEWNVSLYVIHGIQLNSSQCESYLGPIIEISFYIRPSFCLSQCPLWVCSDVNRKEVLSVRFFSVIFLLVLCHIAFTGVLWLPDDLWSPTHRTHHKSDFLLLLMQTAQSTPLAWPCFSHRLFPIASPPG